MRVGAGAGGFVDRCGDHTRAAGIQFSITVSMRVRDLGVGLRCAPSMSSCTSRSVTVLYYDSTLLYYSTTPLLYCYMHSTPLMSFCTKPSSVPSI